MKYRPLGKTGLQVSVASLGTGSLGEMFGPLAESDALRLVDESWIQESTWSTRRLTTAAPRPG